MRRLAILFAAALFAAAPAPSARAEDHPVCNIAGGIAADAMVLRQTGHSQQQAARLLAAEISRAVSAAPGDLAVRREAAAIIGRYATFLLQLAYSLPVEGGLVDKAAAVQAVGQAAYDACRRSW